MITRIDVRNFKGLKHCSFTNIPRNAIIVGPNNSGKTSFLQAIAFWCEVCSHWLAGRSDLPREPDGRYSTILVNRLLVNSVRLPRSALLWTQSDTDDPIVVRLHTARWTVGFEIEHDSTETVLVRPESNVGESALKQLISKPVEPTYIGSFAELRMEEDGLLEEAVDGYLLRGTAGSVLRNVLASVGLQGAKWKELTRLTDRWFGYELLHPSRGRAAYAAYRHHKGEPALDLANAASGFLQTLTLFASILCRERSVILLDEPDAHLHFLLQSKVHDTLVDLARKQGSQLIIATHSRAMIDQSGLTSLRIMTADRAEMRSVPNRKTMTGTLEVSNAEVVMCATEPGVLFVEGKTDRNIVRGWARALKHPVAPFLERTYWIFTSGRPKRATFAQRRFDALRSDRTARISGTGIVRPQ